MNNKNLILLIGLFVASGLGSIRSQELPTGALEFELAIRADEPWSDSGIDLKPGDSLEIRAESWSLRSVALNNKVGQAACDPEGVKIANWESRDRPIRTALPGGLIARLGSFPDKEVLVGKSTALKAEKKGHLFLGVNTDGEDFCRGLFHVSVRIVPEQNSNIHTVGNSTKTADLAALLDRLPRRIRDFADREGDMVNFIIVGPEAKVEEALSDADWVLVDRDKVHALLHAASATYGSSDYTQMPMSELYLFGRTQDFGYAQAEAYKVVASRHHFRLWKVPWSYKGQEVWVGAGTHDIGFEKDKRNGSVTHKINPHIDLERDYIGTTLQTKGDLTYLSPSDPFREGYNASGGKMQSDGRVLLILLR